MNSYVEREKRIKDAITKRVNRVAMFKMNSSFNSAWISLYKFVGYHMNIDTYNRSGKGLNKFKKEELGDVAYYSVIWEEIWLEDINRRN